MICFRFDIDTRAGLTDRTPPLLDALDEAGIRATFFCVMGREANLAEIVRLRFLASKDTKSPLNVAAKGGIAKIAAAALVPRGVGAANPERLVEVVERGHELGPHGWSHIQWQRNLENIDVVDHLHRSIDAYEAAIGRPPVGFAAPGRSCNDDALAAYDAAGLSYAGDLAGDRPFRPEGYRHLQLPITRFETIAQLRRSGLSDAQIVATYLADIDTNPDYCCLYEHPDDLDEAGLAIFAQVFAGVNERGLTPITLAEAAAIWTTWLNGG